MGESVLDPDNIALLPKLLNDLRNLIFGVANNGCPSDIAQKLGIPIVIILNLGSTSFFTLGWGWC